MARRKKRFSRQIAVALTLVLLAGQSHLSTFAQEENVTVDMEVSDSANANEDAGSDGTDNGDTDQGTGVVNDNDKQEGGEESFEEISAEETISGNGDGIEQAEMLEAAMLAAENGVEAYADDSVNTFVVDGVNYKVIDKSTKEVRVTGPENKDISGISLNIPEKVEYAGEEWNVTAISSNAFSGCKNLISLDISSLGMISSIGMEMFSDCTNLENISLPNSVTSIGDLAFARCRKLKDINLENIEQIGNGAFANCDSLNEISLPPQLTSVGYNAFAGCTGLTKGVVIPGGLTKISSQAFWNCISLPTVTIPDTVTIIEHSAFRNCKNLQTLQIIVNNASVSIPVEDDTVFAEYPDGNPTRYLVFMNADGTELPDAELETVKTTYRNAPDGNTDDGLWYGWQIDKLDIDVHTVTVNVRKDNGEWSGHGRSFALSSNNGDSMVTDLSAVEAGTYNVFDVTGGNKIDTGVSLEVDGNDDVATVNYYTVTFCDEDGNPYADNTDQRPQTILESVGHATSPASNPTKEGYTFDKWVTEANGDELFSFATTTISSPTRIYAKWTVNTTATYKVTINVKKDGQEWSGHGRTFALLANGGGSFITDLNKVPNGTYRIYDITDAPEASRYSKAVDTGMDVRVNGADTEVEVTVENDNTSAELHYYTATFYDGDTAYGANTPQKPQIVLKGKQVETVRDPSKEGYTFKDWVTENGGSFNFDTPIESKTDIYASWTKDADVPGVTRYTIVATAGAGGTIDPIGHKNIYEGESLTFTITPSNGYRIQSVKVDGVDMTESIKEAGNSYTFTDVRANHTIDATFEADGSNTGGNGDGNSGGENSDNDNSTGGNGDNNNSGGGNGGGGNSGSGNGHGGNSDSGDSDSGNFGDKNSDGSDLGDGSVAAGGNSAAGSSSSGNVSDGSSEGRQSNAGAGSTVVFAGDNALAAAGNSAAGNKEPKTGDTSHAEVYATIAMIAGLTYLLLYFMEEGRGMTEREKEAFVAAFTRWAKKGGAFRRCCAMVAIFCLLVYYHSIGKRSEGDAFQKEYLGQMS